MQQNQWAYRQDSSDNLWESNEPCFTCKTRDANEDENIQNAERHSRRWKTRSTETTGTLDIQSHGETK